MDKIENELNEKENFIKSKKAIGIIPLNVKFKKLDENAVMPTYAHVGDVGMDMTAIGVEYDENLDMYIYHTGLAFESDFHYGQFLFPRSSNRKTDAYLCNSVGIADSAIYRGEILFCYKNRDSIKAVAEMKANEAMMDFYITSNPDKEHQWSWLRDGFSIYNSVKETVYKEAKELKYAPYKVGDKIGQMVFMPYPDVELSEIKDLSETVRGSNGFGSTGN